MQCKLAVAIWRLRGLRHVRRGNVKITCNISFGSIRTIGPDFTSSQLLVNSTARLVGYGRAELVVVAVKVNDVLLLAAVSLDKALPVINHAELLAMLRQ